MFTLNCKGKIHLFEMPVVMGIINLTTDSFYKGFLNSSTDHILAQANTMVAEGAAILDIGGQSTRPGSKRITAEEELNRIIPAIKIIHENIPGIIISVDTYFSAVAQAAVMEGAAMINDISAGEMDFAMIHTVASLGVPYICMHMKGEPETMHKNPVYDDILKELLDFFIQKIALCNEAGIMDIIIDPGFGFGKNTDQNFKLLKDLDIFKILDKPVMAGLSRKSTIYKTLGVTAADALNGTTVLNAIALQNGADILRVHDVKEAREAIILINAYKKSGS